MLCIVIRDIGTVRMKLDSATMSKPGKLLLYSLWMVIAIFVLTVTSTHYCEISDPETHAKYDLRELIPRDKDIELKFIHTDIEASDVTDFTFIHNIRMQLCPPLVKKCNNQEEYVLCIEYYNSTEKAIGKFPPQVSYQNGHTIFKYGGDVCSGSTRYRIIVSMKCDYQMGNNAHPLIVNFHPSSCIIYVEWRTNIICPTRRHVDCTVAHHDKHYDLTSLTKYSQNYEVHTENVSSKMVLNVCHSVIDKSDINCSSEAGVCMFDEKHQKYINLGKVQRPPSFTNGRIQLEYQDGDLCDVEGTISHTLLKYKTTIIFVCSSSAESTIQLYAMIIEKCHYEIIWYTPVACSVKYLLDKNSYTPGVCIVVNPATKSVYNLQPLMNSDYDVQSERYDYKISLCRSLAHVYNGCGLGTGICNTIFDEPRGKANADLVLTQYGPYLKYRSSNKCDEENYYSTVIFFTCSQNELDFGPVVVKDDECYIEIHWKTNLVCEKQIRCITGGNDPIDLTPLMRSTKNYVVKNERRKVEYHINICRTLVATPELNCGHASAACLVEQDLDFQDQYEVSLGRLKNIPTINKDLQVVLRYVDGGLCPDAYYNKHLSTNITFICSNKDQVSPVYKDYVDCTYLFEWNTRLACTNMTGTWLPPCILEEKVFAHVYDLSALYEKQQMYYVKGKRGKEYSINICNRENYCNGSAVCRKDNNYGSLHGVFFNYKRKNIRLQYSNGDHCRECNHCVDGTHAAEIIFTCNESIGIGTPKIRMESKCKVEFEWQTELICTLNLHANFQNITTDLQNVTVDNELESTKQPPQISIGDHVPKGSPSNYALRVIIFVILILVLVAMAVILRHRRERVWFYNHLRICFQACMLRFYRGWNENPVIFRAAHSDDDSSLNASEFTITDNDDDNASL